MDEKLKHRIVGGVVLASVAVIVIPIMFGSEEEVKTASLSESVVPPNPQANLKTISVPVVDQWSDKNLVDVVPEPIVSPQDLLESEDSNLSSSTNALLDVESIENDMGIPPPAQAKKPIADSTPAIKESVAIAKPKAVEVKPEPELKPKLLTAPESGKAWVVQVGSFSDRSNAERLRDKLIKSGYRAFVSHSRANDRNVVRVRVGPELVRENADRLGAKLQKELRLQTMVVEHR